MKNTKLSENLEFLKLPPQSIDIEQAVLGAILLENDALGVIFDLLKPRIFYKDEHQEICKAILYCWQNSIGIDLLTVTNQLRKSGKLEMVGGVYYVTDITNKIGSSANIEYHIRILVEKYILREIIRISNEMVISAFDDSTDPFDLLQKFEKDVLDINSLTSSNDIEKVSEIMPETLQELEEICKKADNNTLSGIATNFTDLDRITGGWQKSDLIILAARPGMGKTAMALSFARNAAVFFGYNVVIYSLEMNKTQLVRRLLSSESKVDSMRMKLGILDNMEWNDIHKCANKLEKAGLYIDDTPGLNIFSLRAKSRRAKSQYKIDMIIIDYIQLMESENRKQNREQEVSSISRSLKSLAKELNVPIIALSQLSRDVEKRGSAKRPVLSDLRESGSIEQDADQVMFIYRPEYYGITQDEDGLPTTGTAELIIAKNRHGSLSTIHLNWIEKLATFQNQEIAQIDGSFDSIRKRQLVKNDEKEVF